MTSTAPSDSFARVYKTLFPLSTWGLYFQNSSVCSAYRYVREELIMWLKCYDLLQASIDQCTRPYANTYRPWVNKVSQGFDEGMKWQWRINWEIAENTWIKFNCSHVFGRLKVQFCHGSVYKKNKGLESAHKVKSVAVWNLTSGGNTYQIQANGRLGAGCCFEQLWPLLNSRDLWDNPW